MQYILIADDNPDITDILSVYVKKEGYEPVVAKDGIEAEKLYESYKPSALLLDVMIKRANNTYYCTWRRL